MVVKTACVLALAGVFLIVSSRPTGHLKLVPAVEADATGFDAVCSRARRHLRAGRCDEAIAAITAVEDEVRDNVEREPGRELSILMIKARAYWHQMDAQGLEQFLTRFETDYADTSAAGWVRRAAWYERMLGYRFAENLPQAVQAFEKYRELEEQAASSQPAISKLDAMAKDFDLYVKMPAEIGDLYRYMGDRDKALSNYRSALDYATAYAETFQPLDENPEQLLGTTLTPTKYREEILPTAIRECECPRDSTLAILARDVACEIQQADWLLGVAQGCRQPKALASARARYRKAQQALEAHQSDLASLSPADRTRYLALQEQLSGNLDASHAGLAELSTGGL